MAVRLWDALASIRPARDNVHQGSYLAGAAALLKSRLLVYAILLAPVLSLLFVMSGDRVLAFRDGAHYYYPLFHWCRGEWQAGRIPLWNPYENCGTAALADATSSVLYPGKIVFAIPLAYPAAYNLYIIAHVALAGLTTYLAARHWNASRLAAGIAAASYALSGSVLFQYCNVVFLVGAAWLPLALQSGDIMLRKSSWWAVVCYGLVLAMMNLGGDPQTAYHAVLLIGGLYIFRCVRGWLFARDRCAWQHLMLRFLKSGLLVLCGLIVAGGLSACQVLPAAKWARQSQRAAYENPRTIYELFGTSQPERDVVGFFRKPPVGSHQQAIYQFSVGPWRLIEFLWPNISGRMFPTNQRWTRAIPAEGRVWSPSLYMGIVPFILAILSLRFWRGPIRVRYLSWMVALSLLASLGGYGLGWLIEEVRGAAGSTHELVYKPVGGLYWFMVVFLPGYVYFRFPAKLTVIATLGLSLLAARGFDRIRVATSAFRNACGVVGGVSGACAAATWFASSSLSQALVDIPAGAVFGPFDVNGSIHHLTLAFLHVALVCGGIAGVLATRMHSRHLIIAAVSVVEICVANQALLTSVPASAFLPHGQGSVTQGGSRLYRGAAPSVSPPEFSKTSSPARSAELIAWQRQARFARFNLLDPTPVVRTAVTLSSLTHEAFVSELRRADSTGELLRNLLCVSRDRQLGDCVVRPRVWIPDTLTVLEPLVDNHPDRIQVRSREVAHILAAANDPRRVAVIETTDFERDVPWFEQLEGEQRSCQIVTDTPQRVDVVVQTDSECLLILADTYGDDWQVSLHHRASTDAAVTKLLRVNRVMRGVLVPAGDTRVVFQYRPRTFWMGVLVSACSWLAVIGAGLYWSVRRRGR